MRQLWVDFNDVDNSGRTTTLARFAEQDVVLDVGASIIVGDADGLLCDATVVSVGRDGTVVVALNMGTMRQVGRHARLAV